MALLRRSLMQRQVRPTAEIAVAPSSSRTANASPGNPPYQLPAAAVESAAAMPYSATSLSPCPQSTLVAKLCFASSSSSSSSSSTTTSSVPSISARKATATRDCGASSSSRLSASARDATTSRAYHASPAPAPPSSTSASTSASTSSYSADISDYLLNGCKWRDAPKCPDYIGHVSIARTSDGRGRGLFSTRDISAGDIIIVSNAFATSYNDTHCVELYTKISGIVKESPRALRQYYSLAGYGCQDDLAVPDVLLFDPNVPFPGNGCEEPHEKLEIDEKRIVHILNVNSFEGDLGGEPEGGNTKLNGLWLLPSFINHSCCPNASRLVVGEAMFIIASQDINVGEEINISYTDAMAPLKRREENLGMMGYGFQCGCKRCESERSIFRLRKDIREIGERVHELCNGAGQEVLSAIGSLHQLPMDKFPICLELSGLYGKLTASINSMEDLTTVQKKWVLGSYSSAFLGKWLVGGYGTGFKPISDFVNPAALELVEAMKVTVPGMLRTLSFTSILAHVAEKGGEPFSLTHGLVRLALDECIRVYGKQKLDVTMKLMEQSSDIVPFF